MNILFLILLSIVNFKVAYTTYLQNDLVENIEFKYTSSDKKDDLIPPIIVGPDVVEWECPYNIYLLDLMKMNYKVIDDLDGDKSYTLSVVNNALGPFVPRIAGDYDITLRGIDSSGNECRRTIVLRIIDITPPVVKLNDINLNLSDINDRSFSECSEVIIEELSDNLDKINTSMSIREVVCEKGFFGKFEFCVKVVDNAGNETTDVALLRIIDDIEEELYTDKNLLNTNINEVYSIEDIKNKISDSLHKEGILYDSFDLISCDYFSNEKTPGSYTVKYRYKFAGEFNYVKGTIIVSDSKENNYFLLLVLLVPIFLYICRVNKKKKRLKKIS